MSAWVLPDHIADVLPSEARHIEELRRALLDTRAGYGYELVAPPLLEHLESLLTGTGEALDLQTFKLVDQLSGRIGFACRHHAAGRTNRCPPAQPHRCGAAVLLRPSAAHAP
jgi:ATP phosphoribosyltransferase regulatory subunit HisZ